MVFKEKLLYVRALLNLTQAELAEQLSVSYETINRWENGKFSPSKKAEYSFDIFCKQHNIIFDDR